MRVSLKGGNAFLFIAWFHPMLPRDLRSRPDGTVHLVAPSRATKIGFWVGGIKSSSGNHPQKAKTMHPLNDVPPPYHASIAHNHPSATIVHPPTINHHRPPTIIPSSSSITNPQTSTNPPTIPPYIIPVSRSGKTMLLLTAKKTLVCQVLDHEPTSKTIRYVHHQPSSITPHPSSTSHHQS